MARHGRTTITMAALAVLLVVMLVVGWKAATASFPSLGGSTASADTCTNQKVTKRIVRKQVTVSVYNGTGRKGFAGTTMNRIEALGFRAGAVGNAPADIEGDGVQVLTVIKDDPRAQLVSQQFNPPGAIKVVETVLGPGVNVVLGKGSGRPVRSGPATLKLDKPVVTCLDKQTPNPNTGQ